MLLYVMSKATAMGETMRQHRSMRFMPAHTSERCSHSGAVVCPTHAPALHAAW
jgi:hypothetical protein